MSKTKWDGSPVITDCPDCGSVEVTRRNTVIVDCDDCEASFVYPENRDNEIVHLIAENERLEAELARLKNPTEAMIEAGCKAVDDWMNYASPAKTVAEAALYAMIEEAQNN